MTDAQHKWILELLEDLRKDARRLELRQDEDRARQDEDRARQIEAARSTAAALSLTQTQLAEDRGRREGQSGSWDALQTMPSRLSIVESRLDALEKDGRWLDRWVGDSGYLRSYYFIALILIATLSVGALQADTLIAVVDAFRGTAALQPPTRPREASPVPPSILGPGPTP